MSDPMRRSEWLAPEPAEALGALLEVPLPQRLEDDGLPLGWHWLYLLDRPRQGDLGQDGHPVRGVVLAPPSPGRRRMWAGGSIESRRPLRLGERATRRSRVATVEEKHGRSGHLTIVTVEHEISQHDEVAVTETQQVLYRDAASGGPVVTATAQTEKTDTKQVQPHEWELPVDPVLLFRFSALTYNGHRIHYDRDYVRDVEGYPGLLVHGPLQALAMAEVARRDATPRPTELTYRLTDPLFDHQGLVAGSESLAPEGNSEGEMRSVYVRDSSGRVTARGRVHHEPAH